MTITCSQPVLLSGMFTANMGQPIRCMTTHHAASRKLECALVRERKGQVIPFSVFIVKIAWPSGNPTVSGASSPYSGSCPNLPSPDSGGGCRAGPHLPFFCLSVPHRQGGQWCQPGTCRSLGFFHGPVSSSLNWGRQGTHHPGCAIKPVTCTMLRTPSGTQ